MERYKVVTAFELDGIQHEVGEEIMLSEDQSLDLGEKVELA